MAESFHFEHTGTCPICEAATDFVASGPYFRSTLRCRVCNSVPRHRALMHVLSRHYPDWRTLAIHESSPGWDPLSTKLVRECSGYEASQYDTSVPFGSMVEPSRLPCGRYRSENLEAQTWPDERFDLVVTQDVFEHIFDPGAAIAEIARTLRPGGATVMTVPIVRGRNPSRRRARLVDGQPVHLLPPEYHSNPISGGEGSLVTVDWGFDIVSHLARASGLSFVLYQIDNIDLGIRAELIDVVIGFKQAGGALASL